MNVEVNQTNNGQRTDGTVHVTHLKWMSMESENINERVHDRCTIGIMQDCGCMTQNRDPKIGTRQTK